MHESGSFVVSLDFEMYWGFRDKRTLPESKARLLGAREAVVQMLDVFKEYDLHVTWATVGFLFFDNREDIVANAPRVLPTYDDPRLSPFGCLSSIGEDETADPYHFAYSLLRRVQLTPNQEIATHTFSHYYCLEPGQTVAAFAADIAAAISAANTFGIDLRSIVFPRHQMNDSYLAAAASLGLKVYRGTEGRWPYRPGPASMQSFVRRGVRLIDAYANATGHHVHDNRCKVAAGMVNVPASRYFRPYSRRLKYLEPLKLRRISTSMEYAARHARVFHLWWHPEDFGCNLKENIAQLRGVAAQFASLREKHGMQSYTMAELANRTCGL
jgi:peptidoglycan/xylan/chitin deacetylase (PgdA/CDA1 family)